MNLLKSLRDGLLDAPLGLSPENLTVMVKKGVIEHYYQRPNDRGNAKFKKTYDVEIWLLDYTQEINAVIYLLTQWLSANQPNHKANVIRYELDILNHDSCDLLITVADLTETVSANENDQGTYIGACPVSHLDEILAKAGIFAIKTEVARGKHQ